MPSTPMLGSELRAFYAEESTRIQNDFAAAGDGRAAIISRTTVVESILLRLWNQYISAEKNGPSGLALVALGGFGRKWLFPHSDIDLLFLHANERAEAEFKDRLRQFSQEIWDLRMKLSPATRKLSECDRFDPENLEFTVSLLDSRYLAGDPALFAQLQDAAIPKLLAREGKVFSQRLADLKAAEATLPASTFAPFTTAEWLAMDQNTENYTACLDWPAPTVSDPPITATRRSFVVSIFAGRSPSV